MLNCLWCVCWQNNTQEMLGITRQSIEVQQTLDWITSTLGITLESKQSLRNKIPITKLASVLMEINHSTVVKIHNPFKGCNQNSASMGKQRFTGENPSSKPHLGRILIFQTLWGIQNQLPIFMREEYRIQSCHKEQEKLNIHLTNSVAEGQSFAEDSQNTVFLEYQTLKRITYIFKDPTWRRVNSLGIKHCYANSTGDN